MLLWYILFITLGMLGTFSIWHLVCKFYLKDSTIDVILENKKKFAYSVLAIIILITLVLSPHIYAAGICAARGTSMQAETQYSYLFNECRVRTVGGPFIDINRNRGLPGDSGTAE